MPADPMLTHEVQKLKYATSLVSCRLDPTGRFAFAGAQDNKIVRFTLEGGAQAVLTGHDSWVRGLVLAQNGETLISGGYDGKLIWWPAAADAPAPQRTVEAHQGWIRGMALSPDGQLLATCGNDLKVKLWKVADGALVKEWSGHERHVYHVAFHPDGQHLVSGDLTAKFIQWKLDADAPVRQFAIASLSKYDAGFQADYGGPYSLIFTADGSRLIASGITNVTNAFAGVGNPIVVEIDWAQGKDVITHLTKGKINGVGWGVAMHPDGFVVAAIGGQAGGHLFFWKPDQADEFHTLNCGNSARDLSLHPDGVRLATAHHDGHVRVYKMGPK